MNEKRESYYMGRPLSELTKEELIDALDHVAALARSMTEDQVDEFKKLSERRQ